MSAPGDDPWEAWRHLAEREWQHVLMVPGAEELARDQSLEQDEGSYAWVEEAILRTPGGVHLFVRVAREEEGPERVTLQAAADAAGLVATVKARLGMPPGRIEVFGRAGIEIGLEPDDEIEGDELDGPIPE